MNKIHWWQHVPILELDYGIKAMRNVFLRPSKQIFGVSHELRQSFNISHPRSGLLPQASFLECSAHQLIPHVSMICPPVEQHSILKQSYVTYFHSKRGRLASLSWTLLSPCSSLSRPHTLKGGFWSLSQLATSNQNQGVPAGFPFLCTPGPLDLNLK